MTDNTCQVCTRPAPQATICTWCGSELTRVLTDVPYLAAQLRVTLARQDRVTVGPSFTTKVLPEPEDHGVGLAVRQQPLVFSAAASAALTALRRALTDTIRGLAASHAVTVRVMDLDATDLGVLAHALTPHATALRVLPTAPDHYTALTKAHDLARDTIDRDPDHRYAGPCLDDGPGWQTVRLERATRGEHAPDLCPGELYAREDSNTVPCPECGASWDVAERRQWLLVQAEDRLATVGVLAALLADDLHPVARVRNMLDGYVRRGRLTPHGTDPDNPTRPTYLVREARALFNEATERRRKLSEAGERMGA